MGWGQSNIADLTEGTMAACHSERKERAGTSSHFYNPRQSHNILQKFRRQPLNKISQLILVPLQSSLHELVSMNYVNMEV